MILLLAGIALMACTTAAAQTASPYLHLGHPAYVDIDLLIERGVLDGLSPVVRPYRRIDVARAVSLVDTLELDILDRGWMSRLADEFEGELDRIMNNGRRPTLALRAVGEGSARSQWHRDPLRPTGAGGLTGAAELQVRGTFGAVVAETRLRSDNYYLHDPQFPDRVATNRFNQRAEDAYVEVQGPYAHALIGRLYRNWAAPGMQGNLLSDYAYSFDQAALWLGTPTISLRFVTGRLDDFPGDLRRYLALHRLDFQPSSGLALYLAEGVLYSGPGRPFELDFLNPLSVWTNEYENSEDQRQAAAHNVFVAAGVWWRLHGSFVFFGDFTLDDVQVDARGEPPSYAFHGGLVFPRLGRRTAARVSYSQVSNLAYRTAADYEQYSFRGVGLARDVSDSDLFSSRFDWHPTAGLRFSLRLDVMRRGEGDFRAAWPADNLEEVETVLSGLVERTARVALGGRASLGHGAVLEWEAGPNFVRNAGHVSGATETRFVGSIGLRLEGGWRTQLH